MNYIKLVLFASALAVMAVSCGRFSNKQTDAQKNSSVRIVCVSKELNEMMFALGEGDKIVGIDLSSTYPPETKNLPTVGYHRMLSSEGIISLNPTLVLHDGNIAPESVMTQLQKVGIPIKEFKEAQTIEGAKELMRQLGKEFGSEQKAEELCNKLDRDMQTASEKVKQYTAKPKVVIIHFGRASNNYFVMGKRGTQNSMIEWAGGVNCSDSAGFKMLSPEVLVEAQPDVILATDFGFDQQGSIEKFTQLPGVALTPAAKNHKIYRIEEHDIVYIGPRTGENVLMIMDLIHK